MLTLIIGILWTLLIVGLISPSFFSKMFKGEYTRKKIVLILVPAMVVIGIIGAALSPKETTTDQVTQTSTTPTPTSTPVNVLFDLSNAKGKTPEEIVAALGEPTKKFEPNNTQKELAQSGQFKYDVDYEWHKEDQILYMSFDYTTKVVRDFFLDCRGDGYEGSCKNTEQVINRLKAQLNADTSGMRVEAVRVLKDPTSITGIKLIP